MNERTKQIYTELAIRQPDRPWVFLSEAFSKLSVTEKEEWLRTLNVKSGLKSEEKNSDVAAADEVHLSWKLTLRDSKGMNCLVSPVCGVVVVVVGVVWCYTASYLS